MLDSRTIILGGGLSGLSVAHFLDDECLILEAEDRPGGLCRTFSKDGFVYDIGGHIMFSRNEEILGEMKSWLGDNVHVRRRANTIWYRDRFVKYPFENGLAALEKEEIFEILMGFLNRPKEAPENLGEWCHARFGAGLAEKYLLPYNRKIWKRDPAEMALHWVDRVPDPPMEDILKSALGIETEGYTFQLNFSYPRQGGIESLTSALAEKASGLRTGFVVRSVRNRGDHWEVSDGTTTLRGERIVSTIPLPELFRCLESAPADVCRHAEELSYNSLILVMLGVDGEVLPDKTAVYIPDPEVHPHRVCFGTSFSPANAPAGRSLLAAEITAPPGHMLLSEAGDALAEKLARDLAGICGFTPGDVVTSDVQRIKYAYPVYDLRYEERVEAIYRYLDNAGLHFTGRFGAFRYVNMDVCVQMAQSLAQALNEGKPPDRDWTHL